MSDFQDASCFNCWLNPAEPSSLGKSFVKRMQMDASTCFLSHNFQQHYIVIIISINEYFVFVSIHCIMLSCGGVKKPQNGKLKIEQSRG